MKIHSPPNPVMKMDVEPNALEECGPRQLQYGNLRKTVQKREVLVRESDGKSEKLVGY